MISAGTQNLPRLDLRYLVTRKFTKRNLSGISLRMSYADEVSNYSTPAVLLVRDPINLFRHSPIMLGVPLQARNTLLIPMNNLRTRI